MSTEKRRPGWLLWFIPLVSLLTSYVALELPGWWHAADLDSSPVGWMRMIGTTLACVLWCWLILWFFAFTRLSRQTKWKGFVVLVVLVGAAFIAVDEVFFDANLRPNFHFRWQPHPEAKLAQYLEETDTTGLPPIDLTIDPVNDFPRYRGLFADGIVRPSELLDLSWESAKPKELWRHPCGGGFSGFAVAGNVAITLEQRDADEVVVCYDRATGTQRWAYAYPALFKDTTGKGPRSTPTIADGEVYSLGALGDLVCLEGATGKKKWTVNILEDNSAKAITWGMTSSPLVHEDLVIVNAGIDPANNVGRALVAYGRKDGKRVWAGGSTKAGYSSAQLATLAGKRQVLIFDAGGLAGFDLKTGEELWRHEWKTFQDMNIVQPLLLGDDRVLISSEVNNGCAVLKVTRNGSDFAVDVLCENRLMAARQANPVTIGNSIYGLHNGTLVCLGWTRCPACSGSGALEGGGKCESCAGTGQAFRRFWRGRDYGQGQILGVAGSLLIQSEQGDLVLVAADPRRFRELARIKAFKDRRTWNTPALAGRHLFLRNDVEMVCYELPLRE
jgi:outer membrane protein assembly factor BamB